MNVEIKKIDKHEIHTLTKLFFDDHKAQNKFFTQFSNEKEMINTIKSTRKDLFYLIKNSDNICGYISLRGLDEGFDTPRFGIYIFTNYRNKSIGKIASNLVFAECKEKFKFNAIDLLVNKNNKNAIKMYDSLGFFKVNQEYDNFIMRKNF